MAIIRQDGWEGRLSQHITAHFGKRFRWGRTDCAMFTAGAVEAMTGVDIARGLRGYRSENAGLKKLKSKGFQSLEGYFAHHFEQVGLPSLRLGDLVAIEEGKQIAMGVFAGRDVRAMTPYGLHAFPSSKALRGYRV